MALCDAQRWMFGLALCTLCGTACSDDADAGGDTESSSSSTTTGAESTTTSADATGATTTGQGTTAAESSSSDTSTGAGDTTEAGDTTAGDDSSGGDDTTGSVDTVTLSGQVVDFAESTPLPNIQVCVLEQDDIPCATTDADGLYSLSGVPVAEGAIEFTGPARFPSLFVGQAPEQDATLDFRSVSSLVAAVLAAGLGETIDDARGHLALGVLDANGDLLSDVTFTMATPSGVQGYLTTMGIDPNLTATTNVGFSGWINVDPGDVEITASHPTLTCSPGDGSLLGATPDAARVTIAAGYLSITYPFVCE